jgi:hypothetical protein
MHEIGIAEHLLVLVRLLERKGKGTGGATAQMDATPSATSHEYRAPRLYICSVSHNA